MQDQRIFALRTATALAVLSLLPIVSFIALSIWTEHRCIEATVATGKLDGAIAWRINRTDCAGGTSPFYDVAVGAIGHVLTTAATSRGAPVPVSVKRLGIDKIGVTLDRPWRGDTVVELRLRRTGGPAERIDLFAPGS